MSDPLHNFKAVGVKSTYRPTAEIKRKAAELASNEETSHLPPIAKHMAKRLGETNTWAWVHYIGYANIWYEQEMKGMSRGRMAERRQEILAEMDV